LVTTTRFLTLDLARGLALLGVALVNVHAFARGWDGNYALDRAQTSIDLVVEFVVGLFFAYRAFPTLSFLFGAGIVLQWQRMDVDQRSVTPLRGRMVALLILGIAHGLLLWPGDIVSSYAVIGIVVLIAWPRGNRFVLMCFSLVAFLSIARLTRLIWVWSTTLYDSSPRAALLASFAYPDIGEALLLQGDEFVKYGLRQFRSVEIWAAILCGVWFAQSGRLCAWLRNETQSRLWIAVGVSLYVLGAVLDLMAAKSGAWNQYPSNGGSMALQFGATLPRVVGSVFVMFWVARAWANRSHGAAREFFEAAGKTPLTQCFGQSLVFTFVFNDSVGGWYGELGRAAYSGVAVLTFVLWAGFARAWLASGHARGPVEIVWLKLAGLLSPLLQRPTLLSSKD
jgi:uncharacterized protein